MADPKNLRGAKPNPLPPGVDLGARIAADRQREQHAESTSAQSLESFLDPGSDKVLLEQDKKSYVDQPETEQERSRQQKMKEVRQQFLSPGESTEAHQESLTRQEAPRSGRPGADEGEEEGDAEAAEEEALDTQQAAAQDAALRYAAARQQSRQKRDKSTAQERLAKGADLLQGGKKIQEWFRRLGEVATIWGIILLVLELNVQCALTLLNKKNPFFSKASKPEMAACCVINCSVCVSPFIGCILPLFIILGLLSGASLIDIGIAELTNLFKELF